MRTYHLTLSDGHYYDIRADSAAEAIGKALDKNRGLRVTQCFSGNVTMNTDQSGQIHYEVPPHKALPPKPDKPDAP